MIDAFASSRVQLSIRPSIQVPIILHSYIILYFIQQPNVSSYIAFVDFDLGNANDEKKMEKKEKKKKRRLYPRENRLVSEMSPSASQLSIEPIAGLDGEERLTTRRTLYSLFARREVPGAHCSLFIFLSLSFL